MYMQVMRPAACVGLVTTTKIIGISNVEVNSKSKCFILTYVSVAVGKGEFGLNRCAISTSFRGAHYDVVGPAGTACSTYVIFE
uniref:Uncharacterized protein n=1 Tax=mine drainage metagenome TaxID=410659 RepID=E6Q0R2_9ZZZZ